MNDRSNACLELATSADAWPSGVVRRPGLVQDLAKARQSPLVLIVAPPGYGKSTLLAEWAEHDERPFTWLALGQGPRRTISARTVSAVDDGGEPLARLLRRLRATEDSFVVVLDDAHLATASVLRKLVHLALDELPAGSTLALASRTEPPLALGRLRANRRLCEVRMHKLAMNASEATALLRHAGLSPEFEEVRSLVSSTEGWPAALYLAALAAQTDAQELSAFDGQHHLLCDYVRDEVLADLPDDLAGFSIRTSVMDELTGSSCDSLLDRHGSAVVLDRLARLNPLLIATDPAHRCYRWQRMMRVALQAELERTEPELERVLRLRASSWYSRRGDNVRAIDQAAAACDPKLTGELLWPNVLAHSMRGQNELVRGWLRNFCEVRIAEHAPLALSASVSALVAGNVQDARHLALAATAALNHRAAGEGHRSLDTGLVVIDAVSGTDEIDRMTQLVLGAAKSEPEDSPWRPVCSLLGGVGTHLQGDRDAAERLLDDGIRMGGNSAPTVTALCLAQRAMIAIEREDWPLATDLTDRAATLIEECRLMNEPVLALVFSVTAASRAHDGRSDEAKRDLRCGIDLLAALGDFVPWYAAEARILLAHASLWLADVVGARTLLAEASRFARRTTGATTFSNWFESAWAYMDTLAETSLAGPSSLTIAELRILRFLPSHRSFREIATQLGVSANTVKTQAHAVYRKLGAASRSEAVALASEAGLLGQ